MFFSEYLSLHQVTPLHLAAKQGHTDIVKCLVAIKAKINVHDENKVTDSRLTTVHEIMIKTILTAIATNVVIYVFSFHQRTPLHMAARGGHEKTVKYLVENGADVNSKDNDKVRKYITEGRLMV